jgi:copper(I)-binding protein
MNTSAAQSHTFSKTVRLLLGLACLLVSSLHLACSESVSFHEAWIREPPPRSPAAAYVIIKNSTSTAIELTGVQTDVAERTEIHVMEHVSGIMKMRRTDSVTVAAGGELSLQSGATHLMLMGLRQPLRSGDVVELALQFADGTESIVQASVRKGGYGSN